MTRVVAVDEHGGVVAAVAPDPIHRPRWQIAAAALLGAAAVLLLWASPASAHASVVATSPGDGQSLAESPAEFTVSFTEPVDTELGGLSVVDRDGDRVDLDDTATDDAGRLLRVHLEPDLVEGTYVGTWRVVSSDGHPISGSVLFAVGTAVDPSGLDALTARTDPGWEVAGTAARFTTFTAALLAAGLGFFLAFVHDQRRDRWSLASLVRAATLIGLAGVVATVAVQAALATGRGLDAVTDADVVRSVLTESLGWQSVVLLAGLALMHLSTDTERLLVAQGCAFYGWVAVSVGFVLWGHATEAPYRWLSILTNGVHVATAALWFGGLVALALVLHHRGRSLRDAPATGDDAPPMHTPSAPSGTTTVLDDARPDTRRALLVDTAGVVGRFSTTATVGVLGVALTGVAMTWIQSDGSTSALLDTTYGRLLLTKVALVAVVAGLGAYNRQRLVPTVTAPAELPVDVPATRGAATATDAGVAGRWARLRRTLVVEVVVLVAVLALTAVLVNVTPARTAATTGAGTVTLTGAAGDGTVALAITPARAGTNTLRVQYLDAAGEPVDIATDLRVEYELPAAELGPLTRDVVKVGPGSFVVEGSELSIPGRWEIALAVRPSDFREVRTPFVVDIP